MKKLIRAAALTTVTFLTGCCTMVAHNDHSGRAPGPYAGVRGYAVLVAHSADMNLKEYPEQILMYFDLPFSFVLDTLLLPLDIMDKCKEPHDNKPGKKDDKAPDQPDRASHGQSSSFREPVGKSGTAGSAQAPTHPECWPESS
jgi:uncharacterized protein YceK